MRTGIRRPVPMLALVLVACLLSGPGFSRTCLRQKVAETTLRDDWGFISMPVLVGGRPATLLVDTGSDTGLMTEAGVVALGLRRDPAHRTLLQGTGGTGRMAPNVLLPDLSIGGLFVAGGSVAVGSLPSMPVVDPPLAGLLGADMLSRFDVEFDLPHRRIAFWRIVAQSVACASPNGWSGRYDTIPLERSGDRMKAAATLDGRPISVLVDTGARSRIVSTKAAARLGVGNDRLGADPGGVNAGVDLHETAYHWHRFDRLTIGGETVLHPVLTVAPLAEPVDMLLGADWFAGRDVWISYAVNAMFVRPGDAASPMTGPRTVN